MFAGIATVAASVMNSLESDCKPKTINMPIALFNGTQDPILPYEGRESEGNGKRTD